MNALVAHIASLLEDLYGRDEAEALAWWVAEEMTGQNRTQLQIGCKDTTFSADMQEVVERLRHFEPIQYIFGHMEWSDLDLKVTPATLIPRPETAELVKLIIERQDLKTERSLRVLDIGTGSGCITLALKKMRPEWEITGIDISSEAIAVAKENGQRNHIEADFRQMDIFSDSIECFDVVASNPPYVRESEKSSMRRNVLDYEPATALFVPDGDPLIYYRRIASLHLGRYLFFEINEALSADVADLLHKADYVDIQIHQDCYGKNRFISCRMA